MGLGGGENFIDSDVPALLAHTRRVIRLGERELAVIMRENVTGYDHFAVRLESEMLESTWDAGSAEKGGSEHFMLTEIMEQFNAVRRTVTPRSYP